MVGYRESLQPGGAEIDVIVFDVLLVVLLVGYGIYGYRKGLVYALGAVAGLILGGVIAFFLLPIVGNWVPWPEWRVVIVIAVAIALLAGGHALGVAAARAVESSVRNRGLRFANRFFGAIVNVIAAALVLTLVTASLATFGIPALSRLISQSVVLSSISKATPDPVESLLAQVRSTVVQDGLPAITEALGGITEQPVLPSDVDTGSTGLEAAAQSVVRITGTAPECAQNQAGSGFVVTPGRVITNAHVVSGVSEPVIETPAGQVLAGTVVYFDPIDDLAIIAVKGLDTAPLALGSTLAKGAKGVIDGYPFGGPFVTSAAEVLAVSQAQVNDIYGETANSREVYSLATTVNEGDSGGPLLSSDGSVAGVVFAKSANTANLGYAMTLAELSPVVEDASGLTKTVASGRCVRG